MAWGMTTSGACTMKKEFGSCCEDLKTAMQHPPNSFFSVEENGVLYLTVGYVATEDGPGFFDQAVMYCPFCGTKLQDKDEIRRSKTHRLLHS
jgi:hypothetical protein